MTTVFRDSWLEPLILAAWESTCEKSKRGCLIYNHHTAATPEGKLVGTGWNGPPHPFICGKDKACKASCNKVAVHAEEMALLEAGTLADGSSLIHLKIENGKPVYSGPPSCWQCSRAILHANVGEVWLFHLKGWKSYSAVDFHRITLWNNELPNRAEHP